MAFVVRARLRPLSPLLFALAIATFQHPGRADAKYPDRPVRIVLPFAAGGVADVTARVVAEKLSEKLGQRFYVENQAGAGGIVAAPIVASSPPDGYTLALLSNGTANSVSLFKKLPYDPLKDFVPISSLGFFDFIFATAENSSCKTLSEFIATAKAKPGSLNVGTINVASTQNRSAEWFKTAAGVDFAIIPYRGTPEILVGLLQGDVVLTIDSYCAKKGNLAEGKLRALASSGAAPSEATPELATVRKSGVADYDVLSWNALFAPSGTPPAIVNALNAVLREILADRDLKGRLIELGIEAKGGTPQEIYDRLRSDIDKWRVVIDKAGIERSGRTR
jgi:tripartite-type tricarboxylate transporter receptor subunit TctC